VSIAKRVLLIAATIACMSILARTGYELWQWGDLSASWETMSTYGRVYLLLRMGGIFGAIACLIFGSIVYLGYLTFFAKSTQRNRERRDRD
jgi:hypothetical protein